MAWRIADILCGTGFKQDELPALMMPFFALVLVDARLARVFEEIKITPNGQSLAELDRSVLSGLVLEFGQGHNAFIFERGLTLQAICKSDKTFQSDFTAYLNAFDEGTKKTLGIDPRMGAQSGDLAGVIAKLKTRGILLAITRTWCAIDLSPYEDTATPIEEHIRRAFSDF